MKFIVIFLTIASLAANAWLIKTRLASPASSAAASSSAIEKSAVAIPPLTAETWALIESGDPAGPAALRALGLPESALRTLIRAEVDKRYRSREDALYTDPSTTPFWNSKYNNLGFRPTDHMKLLDLRREKEAELKRLLGSNYRDGETNTNSRTAFLSPEKAEQVRLLNEDYEAMSNEASAGLMSGFFTRLPDDAEKSKFLAKQKRDDLAAVLDPTELAEYELRNSTTTNQLRSQLFTFDPTEEEFKTLYALRKDFDEQYSQPTFGVTFTPDAEQAKARQKAQEEVNAKIKTALGEERYADYERAQDQEYKTLTRVAARLDLPKEKVIAAHTLKNQLEKKLRDFKPTPGTNARNQRTELQATLLREAETGFTEILGKQGYEVYKDNSQIFRRLQPPTPPPASPKP